MGQTHRFPPGNAEPQGGPQSAPLKGVGVLKARRVHEGFSWISRSSQGFDKLEVFQEEAWRQEAEDAGEGPGVAK